ncbi:hypothetical protein [Kitasatospora cheerisanensis]|uniref:Uncharacterized protein n=1 Tax=Kitasatospora cheerisanensis KCTC 2395 TaxID=1348663 RepID=A0A066YH47_9ACTN|nr:hypothetical protein [Kitasatospora cheerisanensis]KDN80477.1 hypothetical protein KCH_77650 [Kitasatospora cheerisanensis KCTC 2395]
MSTVPVPRRQGDPALRGLRTGDAQTAPDKVIDEPCQPDRLERWQLVWIRLGGRWRPGVLLAWRRALGGRWWLALVQWDRDTAAWFYYEHATIRPLPARRKT